MTFVLFIFYCLTVIILIFYFIASNIVLQHGAISLKVEQNLYIIYFNFNISYSDFVYVALFTLSSLTIPTG